MARRRPAKQPGRHGAARKETTKQRKQRIDADARRSRAAELAARGWTYKRIAAALFVHQDTVGVWLSEDDVRAQVQRLREGALEDTRRALLHAGPDFAETLIAGARGELGQPAVANTRIKAACSGLDRMGVVSGTTVKHSGEIRSGNPASGMDHAELRRRLHGVLADLEGDEAEEESETDGAETDDVDASAD